MRRIALFASLAVLIVPLRASTAPAACEPTEVPGIGRACRDGMLWRIFLPDGSSRLTHGGDPVPPPGQTLDAVPTSPVCVDPLSRDAAGLVVYAVSADRPDRFDEMADQVRSMVSLANGVLREEAAEFGRRLDYRIVCDGDGRISVAKVIVESPLENTDFYTILAAMYSQGHVATNRKYWIWYDGRPPGAPGGIGTFETDDSSRAHNRNNVGPSFGVTFGRTGNSGARILMHENGHNLGAVQFSSPSSTHAGHCWDGIDVMCYNDGGPRGNWYRNVCDVSHFDCGHDDYFHPDPQPGSYLDRYWNLASPHNRYVQGCMYAAGTIVAGVASEPVQTSTVAVSIPPGCDGRRFSAYAMMGGSPAAPLVAVSSPTRRSVDIDVCWFAGAAPIRCHAEDSAEQGSIPAGATEARLTLKNGAGASYLLTAV